MSQTQPKSPAQSTTTPQRGPTARQRRIDEQRRRIEAHQQEQRRKRLTIGGVILVAVLAIIAAFWFLMPKPVAAQGHQVPIEGNRQHQPQGTPIQYRNRPPSSGDHYDNTAPYGVTQTPVATGNWVHNLEHGAVVLLYHCPRGCPDLVARIDTLAARLRPDRNNPDGTARLLAMPETDMDHLVAVIAWGHLRELDEFDEGRIADFYATFVDQGPECRARICPP
jgi:hypothetical protein